MVSLWCPREQRLLKKYQAQRHAIYLRHVDLFVHLFPRVVIREVPPTQNVKISPLYYNFSLTIEGICLLSCIYVLGHK